MPVPDTGHKILDDIVDSIRGYTVTGMSEFDEKRLKRDIEKIPSEHLRYMCWGMFYAIKKDAKQSLEYHNASLVIEADLYGYRNYGYGNFVDSLYYLGYWSEALDMVKQWHKQLPSNESKNSLRKALFNNGLYTQAHALGHDDNAVELCQHIKLMQDVLGSSFEQEYARIHQEFVQYCFKNGAVFSTAIKPVRLLDPASGDENLILQVFSTIYDEVSSAQLVPNFLNDSKVLQEVSFELMYRISFSIASLNHEH